MIVEYRTSERIRHIKTTQPITIMKQNAHIKIAINKTGQMVEKLSVMFFIFVFASY